MKPQPQPTVPARLLRLLSPWATPLDPVALLRSFRLTVQPHPGPAQTQSPGTESLGTESPGTRSTERERAATPTIRWGTDHTIDATPDDYILDTLEAAGLEPTFGCRRGVCRRCVVPLDAGCVRDRRDERDIDAGTHIRICVTSPLTDIDLNPTSSNTFDQLATAGASS